MEVFAMNRAYSLLEIKAFDEDERTIEGIATTPSADRMGDVVEPKGADFKLPLPLLWQHNSDTPIGHVTKAKVTRDGIEIVAKLVRVEEPGALQARLDEAWQSIKSGLVRGLSIGFAPVETSRMEDTGGFRFLKWLWLELSAVTIPANADANITTIKALDAYVLAQQGTEHVGAAPAEPAPAASKKAVRIVRLDDPARVRAEPFVIRKIKR
jgi:HK97 family phage prohead protease